MPTKPLESILYRDLSVVEANEYIAVASRLLQELVNYSTNLYARCGPSTKGEEDEDVAIFVLFLHMIEMTDGIEILISHSNGPPAIPILRSSFEATLSMHYILENEENYPRRSLAWLAGHLNERLTGYDLINPNSDKGKRFYKNADQEGLLQNMNLPDYGPTGDAERRVKSMLGKAQFNEVEEARRNYARRYKRRRPQWYSLFDGPQNLRELAQHLGMTSQYDLLYRQWSSVAHSTDLSRFVVSEGGENFVGRLRNPEKLSSVMNLAPTFMIKAIQMMMMKFRPGEANSSSQWYIREVQNDYKVITNTD